MTDETTSAGMSRREVLRRGAVVGGVGAVAWAAPSITALGPRAFAQTGTEEPGGPGLVSWVMVWFRCGDDYYRVKYEGGASGYTELCGAGRGNVSNDGPEGAQYYDIEEGRAAGLNLVDGCPAGVSAGAADGLLRITIPETCSILGWVLHDGSCGNPTGGQPSYPRFRSKEFPYRIDGDASSGVVGPVDGNGGPFEWDKCR
jgi:hypothetical protein